MAPDLSEDHSVFLLTLPAGRREQRIALAVVPVSVVLFLVAAPFARLGSRRCRRSSRPTVGARINDLITAVLLFGQFGLSRSRALLLLGAGYLFTALMAAFMR